MTLLSADTSVEDLLTTLDLQSTYDVTPTPHEGRVPTLDV